MNEDAKFIEYIKNLAKNVRIEKEKQAEQARLKKEIEKKAQLEIQRQKDWDYFLNSWKRKIEFETKTGNYSAIVYYFKEYDLPDGQYLEGTSSPKIGSFFGTSKKVFDYLTEKGLNPQLVIKQDGIKIHDSDGGMHTYNYIVGIEARW